MCVGDEDAPCRSAASKREILLEPEHQTMRMHRFLEWGLMVLCTSSFLIYLLQSRAAEKYVALYVRILGKLFITLGT